MNKKIIAGVILLILLLAGGYYVIAGRNASNAPKDEEQAVDKGILELAPEDIGLELEALNNNQQIVFTITKPEGIKAIEYELTYVAEDEQPRGVIGEIEDITGDTIESKPLDLGSCSSGVCKYDKGVKSVELLLKITKDDNKDYQVKETLKLE